MKKLQKLLFLAVFSIGIMGTVNAQITPDKVQNGVVAGGNFTYTVPEVADHSWTWEVLDNTGAAVDPGNYSLVDVSPAVGYKKNITWNANGTFYVRVTAQNKTTSCTNDYVIQVNVASNDYTVAFNAGTEDVYCADDANIASGMEVTLDIKLASNPAAAEYYDMTVHYQVDGADHTATIGTDNKFTIPTMDVVDPVNPAFTSVIVKIVKVVDANGVEFTPTAGNESLTITIHAIPAKPTITF
ncbi:hypothetical protein [Marinifilum fragile]|uniref:hypothetical protein n=1 Tax=Marinifilum fragile TaxID=570161 RepID=UPI0006CFA0C8|nr:hypothetical protein [Marinifilum fragile]